MKRKKSDGRGLTSLSILYGLRDTDRLIRRAERDFAAYGQPDPLGDEITGLFDQIELLEASYKLSEDPVAKAKHLLAAQELLDRIKKIQFERPAPANQHDTLGDWVADKLYVPLLYSANIIINQIVLIAGYCAITIIFWFILKVVF